MSARLFRKQEPWTLHWNWYRVSHSARSSITLVLNSPSVVGIDYLGKAGKDGWLAHSIASALIHVLPSSKPAQSHHDFGLSIKVILSSPALVFWFNIIPDKVDKFVESLRRHAILNTEQSIINSFLQERWSKSTIPAAATAPLSLLLHSLILKNTMSNKSNTQLLPSMLELFLVIIFLVFIRWERGT